MPNTKVWAKCFFGEVQILRILPYHPGCPPPNKYFAQSLVFGIIHFLKLHDFGSTNQSKLAWGHFFEGSSQKWQFGTELYTNWKSKKWRWVFLVNIKCLLGHPCVSMSLKHGVGGLSSIYPSIQTDIHTYIIIPFINVTLFQSSFVKKTKLYLWLNINNMTYITYT